MKKIELTEQEVNIINAQLNGEIEVWTDDEEIQKTLMGVIKKAKDLMEELDAYDELGDDLIEWFHNKYLAQQIATTEG